MSTPPPMVFAYRCSKTYPASAIQRHEIVSWREGEDRFQYRQRSFLEKDSVRDRFFPSYQEAQAYRVRLIARDVETTRSAHDRAIREDVLAQAELQMDEETYFRHVVRGFLGDKEEPEPEPAGTRDPDDPSTPCG